MITNMAHYPLTPFCSRFTQQTMAINSWAHNYYGCYAVNALKNRTIIHDMGFFPSHNRLCFKAQRLHCEVH